MKIKLLVVRLALFAAILLIWEYAPVYGIISKYAVAPLSQVISSFPTIVEPNNPYIPHGLPANVYATLYEIIVAFAISVILGLTIGFAIGYYKTVGDAYEPLVYVVHAIPGIIIYPIFYLTLGFGVDSKILFGIFLGVFPLIINTTAGIRQTRSVYVKLAKSLGASDSQVFLRVLIPSAAPNIMSGLRLSLASVIIGVIAGEIVASGVGLGRVINNFGNVVQLGPMYDCIILVIIISLAFYFGIAYVEKRVLPYEKK